MLFRSVYDADAFDTDFNAPNTSISFTYSLDGTDAGAFSIDANGDWQYQLDNAKAQHLNAGDALIERFLVVAKDGHGGSETHEVMVTVHGTADAPIIPSVVQGTAKPGAGETLSGQVLAHDADAGDTLSFTLLSQPHGQYGTLSFDQDGNWQYQLDPASSNSTLRALAEGEQAVDSFTVQVRDNAGNVAQQQIQLQVSGSNDAPQIGGATSGVVMDQTSVQASGQLSISDPDSGDRALITAQSLDGAHGHFQVDDSGHWTYRLDSHDPAVRALNEGESLTETFHVIATDQSGAQSGRDVVVTIHGSNDTPVVTGDTDGSTQEDGNSLAQGTLTVSDPDTGDSTEWIGMNTASAYGHFQMSSDGVWVYRLNDNAPQVQALQDGLPAGVWTLAQVSRGRLDPEYRHHFYQATGWQEEVGLILPVRGGLTLMLFLGRLDKRQSLRPKERARLEALFPLVHSLCRQQWREAVPLLAQNPARPDGADLKATVEQAIASVGGDRLTRRERQVAGLLLQGLDTEAIAAELGIGSGTVKNHRKHLYGKLRLGSRAELFSFFLNHLITAPSGETVTP